jgi:hypothetical protein
MYAMSDQHADPVADGKAECADSRSAHEPTAGSRIVALANGPPGRQNRGSSKSSVTPTVW